MIINSAIRLEIIDPDEKENETETNLTNNDLDQIRHNIMDAVKTWQKTEKQKIVDAIRLHFNKNEELILEIKFNTENKEEIEELWSNIKYLYEEKAFQFDGMEGTHETFELRFKRGDYTRHGYRSTDQYEAAIKPNLIS